MVIRNGRISCPVLLSFLPFTGRFWTGIVAPDSADKGMENRPNNVSWVTPFVFILDNLRQVPSSMWLQYIGINILRIQTKGVTHKCLFGRFWTELVPLSGARKPMENRPGKGRNQVKAVIKSDYSYSSPSPSSPNFYPIVDKVLPFISRFWTEISALDSGTNSVQNRPNKHLWVTPFVCVLSIFIPIYCNHIDDVIGDEWSDWLSFSTRLYPFPADFELYYLHQIVRENRWKNQKITFPEYSPSLDFWWCGYYYFTW